MIRPAIESDLPEVLRMGEAFLARTAFSHVPFDGESASRLCLGLIQGAGVIYVADSGDKLSGMIGMVTFPHYFNSAFKAAQEFFWWVEPESRGNGIALRLVKAAEDWAKEQGCSTVHMLCLDDLNGDAVSSMYLRRGYKALERTFVRQI